MKCFVSALRGKSIMVFAMLSMALFSGCGIYGKYSREDMDTDGLFGNLPEGTDTMSSMASMNWRDFFTDSYLRSLIEQALDANTDLKIAGLKVEEARVSLEAAKLAYLPSLQLNPEGTVSRYGKGNTDATYNIGLSANWEIDLFGKLTNAKRAELAALEQSEAYRKAVHIQLVSTVAESYYTLLMLDEQIRITEETIASWNEYIRSLRAMMKAGEADRAAVSQAEASRLNAESSLWDLKRQVSEMENTLCSLLFIKPGHIERGVLSEQQFPDTLSVGVPFGMLSSRPDVVQAEAALKEAFYLTNQARSSFYPSITLEGIVGWTNSGGAVISDPGTWLFKAIASLVQPVFNRGKNIANLKISKMQQQEAMLQFQQVLLDAGMEVNDALVSLQVARNKMMLDSEQVEYLKTAVHDTRLLMEHGHVNYLEVITARQSLLSSELALVADRNNEIQSIVKLYHALGGGYDTADEAD